MTYDPLTLRYRPRSLDEVVGQEAAVDIVRGMLASDRVTRTLLIHGPWGCGKTSLARVIAMHLNCEAEGRAPIEPPCGTCDSCTRIHRGDSSDYREMNAANQRKIDDIRALDRQSHFRASSKYRIFVLDEVHQLTPQAFQAFLKTTEHPPPETLFILCTTDTQKIPPALKSRCAKLPLGLLPKEAIHKRLEFVADKEELPAEVYTEELLDSIAGSVNGHMRDALCVLEAVINSVAAGFETSGQDLDAFVTDVVEQVVGDSPEALVAEYLLGIYRGKYTRSILALHKVMSHSAFIDTILRYHAQTMYFRFSGKLQEPQFQPWYSMLADMFGDRKKISIPALTGTMDIFTDTAQAVKGYEVDGFYLLLNAAMKAATLCREQHDGVFNGGSD